MALLCAVNIRALGRKGIGKFYQWQVQFAGAAFPALLILKSKKETEIQMGRWIPAQDDEKHKISFSSACSGRFRRNRHGRF